MNKTVNINLANILFHIDEDAYNKMRRYLEAVRRSFANTPGSDEILADIEARIAELFHEKLENERQVITQKEVDEVIAIMGQPEDYMVDEDIFEDEPRSSASQERKRVKKLYRDTEQKYVAGVSSGLAHYLGIDPIWVRLLWIVLTLGSGGGFILLYGLLWILIPEAATTAQKLDMRGEAVNISNIERKVKEGFDDVAEKIKSVDYDKVGSRVKDGGKTFFDTLGDIIMFLFKVIGKFVGILLIIIGAAVIIGMFVGMLTVGTLDWIHLPGLDGFVNNVTDTPVWLLSLLFFFVIGIPFFFLLYLGLKILVTNLKSIGNIAKFTLLGLWLISLISLIVIGVREAASHAFDGAVKTSNELYMDTVNDTLNIQLATSELWDNRVHMRMDDSVMTYDDDGQPVLLSDDVRFRIRKSKDSIARIEVRKEANGPSIAEAKGTAEKIDYAYKVQGNTLVMNDFLTTLGDSKFKDQQVRVNLLLPAGAHMKFGSTGDGRNWRMRADTDKATDGLGGYLWKMGEDGELKCQDCPENIDSWDEGKGEDGRIIINEDGIDINFQDEDGESFKMKIDEDGVNIKAKDKDGNDIDKVIINEDEVDIDVDDNRDTLQMKIDKDGVRIRTGD
ncbi:PspC domain-containing protein [Flavobacteriaceae bacterium TP-CH-4]|uniref:PspC domain-containing protein n=1 Tax=Pelagihabitans pacificus TaxID=2696054 RepID=A0A967AZR2_9FLAO|nr:PspC domain-containing protein [Pelagihabitans pacificus]NHF59501.1 PspC domain-containing protein [Pelagihabitans pacificus]